jgi:putative nucleotidyltransferase with HDIG domain
LISTDEAKQIWRKYNDDEHLYKHALAVEATMRHFAPFYGGDENEWAVAGILHDIDYQHYPELHCVKAKEILNAEGIPEHIIRAVISHGYGLLNDVEPSSDMEKVLYAVDELTGFITACALVRPSRSVEDLEVKSVLKKWRTPAFAQGVDRKVVENGANMLGMLLDKLIFEVIAAMRKVRGELDL